MCGGARASWKLGTRVLPVFVFSLLQHEQRAQASARPTRLRGRPGARPRDQALLLCCSAGASPRAHLRAQLFDSWHPVAASKDAVLVVQSGSGSAALPFFSAGRQLSASLQDPTAHIIAGVAQARPAPRPAARRLLPSLTGRDVSS
jgi:hypothetical protein